MVVFPKNFFMFSDTARMVRALKVSWVKSHREFFKRAYLGSSKNAIGFFKRQRSSTGTSFETYQGFLDKTFAT